MLGDKIKEAIERSGLQIEEIAAHVGMSSVNLRRLYKKDSTETKYLIKLAEKLELPLGYFLNDETIGSILHGNTGQANYANKVGSNQQSISVGGMSREECEQQLKDLQEKYELAIKSLADKDLIIEMLQENSCEHIIGELVSIQNTLKQDNSSATYSKGDATVLAMKATILINRWPIDSNDIPKIQSKAKEYITKAIIAASKNNQKWIEDLNHGIDYFIDSVLGH